MNNIEQAVLDVVGMLDPLTLKLRGGGVLRYHGEPGIRSQTVAEHSWRVAVILHHIWPERHYLLTAALYHDVGEGLIGDIPAPVKRLPGMAEQLKDLEEQYVSHLGLNKYFHEMLDEDRARLKVADYLELVETCSQQNTDDAYRVCCTGVRYVLESLLRLPEAERSYVVSIMRNDWGNRLPLRAHEHLDKFDDRRHSDKTGHPAPFGFDPTQDVV